MYRRYSDSVEQIAKEWFETPLSNENWVLERPVDSKHITSPWWAKSEKKGLRAVMKPGPQAFRDAFAEDHADLSDIFENLAEPYINGIPVAAIEKIISDLAYVAGLPVPPVRLYRNEQTEHFSCRKVCLSLLTDPVKSRNHKADAVISSMNVEELADFLRVYSAMSVFKGWVDSTDKRLTNIVINTEKKYPDFVDFSISSLLHWRKPHGFLRQHVSDVEMLIRPDVKSMLQTIKLIPDDVIGEIIQRVPEEFMSQKEKNLMREGLIYRKDNLERLVSRNNNIPVYDDPLVAASKRISRKQRYPGLDPDDFH